MVRLAMTIVVVGIAGCVTPRNAALDLSQPPVQSGTVSASNASDANMVRRRLHAAIEWVDSVLSEHGVVCDEFPEVWVIPNDYLGFANAATFFSDETGNGRIVLSQAAVANLDYSLTHELVHFELGREPYLPPAIEEGLACALAWVRVTPDLADSWLLNPKPKGPSLEELRAALRVRRDEVLSLSPEEFQSFRRAGVFIVRCFGWPTILNWRLESQAAGASKVAVPADVLEALGL